MKMRKALFAHYRRGVEKIVAFFASKNPTITYEHGF
jgi:hypothetical protein